MPTGDLEVLDGGRVLVGGSPWRMMRLSDAGGRAVSRWLEGRAPEGEAEVELARRCVDAGMFAPLPAVPPAPGDVTDVTVVIPVRDRPDGLRATLAGLAGSGSPCIVVDDGSVDPDAHARVAAEFGAMVHRREVAGGPAVARNAGLGLVGTPFVGFVDSDVRLDPATLRRLRAHLEDPTLDAVAPRVVSAVSGVGATLLERYEATASPLDLGSRPSPIRPGARVTYAPAAVLCLRADTCRRLGGFDEQLRVGEDVDLLWRLHDAGGRAWYEPDAVAVHQPRTSWCAAGRQRVGYGESAAALHRRHGAAVAPLRLARSNAVALVAALAGRPTAGLAVVGATSARAVRQLDAVLRPLAEAPAIARRAVLRGQLGMLRKAARSVIRPYAPVALAVALISRRSRRLLLGAAAASVLVEYLERRPDLDPARWAAAWTADEVAYSVGVWRGVVASGDLGAVRPVVTQD